MHAYVRVHSETYVLVCVYLIVIHAYVRVDMVKTQCMHPPANDTQQPRDGTAEHNNRRKRLDADCPGVRCGFMSTAVGVRWLGLVWVVGCHRQGGAIAYFRKVPNRLGRVRLRAGWMEGRLARLVLLARVRTGDRLLWRGGDLVSMRLRASWSSCILRAAALGPAHCSPRRCCHWTAVDGSTNRCSSTWSFFFTARCLGDQCGVRTCGYVHK